MNTLHTIARRISGEDAAAWVASSLTKASAWFTMQPLPNDEFEFVVKLDRSQTLEALCPAEEHLELVVATVSDNRNSFGLRGMVLISRDGSVWQVATSYLHAQEVGMVVRVPVVDGTCQFASLGWELPEKLPDAPKDVVEAVWASVPAPPRCSSRQRIWAGHLYLVDNDVRRHLAAFRVEAETQNQAETAVLDRHWDSGLDSAGCRPAFEFDEPVLEVKIVVVGEVFDGPDLYFCIVRCRECQYDKGEHYEAAKEQALEAGYDGPLVAIDEHDRPQSLFDLFQWETASLYDIAAADD